MPDETSPLEGTTDAAPRKTVALVEAEQRANEAWRLYGDAAERANRAERRADHAERHVRILADALSQWHDGNGAALHPTATQALVAVVHDLLDVPAVERRPLDDEPPPPFGADDDSDVSF